jgi:hypothetical protein
VAKLGLSVCDLSRILVLAVLRSKQPGEHHEVGTTHTNKTLEIRDLLLAHVGWRVEQELNKLALDGLNVID